MAEIHDQFDTILILDFGSQVCLPYLLAGQAKAHLQYSHLITRRCRELNVYAELMPCTQKVKALTWKPKGEVVSHTTWGLLMTIAQASSSPDRPIPCTTTMHPMLILTYSSWAYRSSAYAMGCRCVHRWPSVWA